MDGVDPRSVTETYVWLARHRLVAVGRRARPFVAFAGAHATPGHSPSEEAVDRLTASLDDLARAAGRDPSQEAGEAP